MNTTFLCRRDKLGARRIAREWKRAQAFCRDTFEELKFYHDFIRGEPESHIQHRNLAAIENQRYIDSIHHRIACEKSILSTNQQPCASQITQ